MNTTGKYMNYIVNMLIQGISEVLFVKHNINKRKKKLTFENKCAILTALEDGEKPNIICQQYGVTKCTISKIKSNKSIIKDFAKNSMQSLKKIKRITKVKFPEIESTLYQWFLNERLKHTIIDDNMLMIKALEFHRDLNSEVLFTASHGWIQKFKRRHSIRMLKICGEKLSGNDAAVPGFLESFKVTMELLGMNPEQIYNADETGLIFRNLNCKTLVTNTETSAPGRKNSKERITVMGCVNATGQHKLPLMIIGRSIKPRCFQNVTLPDMHYRASKNAWQTKALFKDWFHTQFVPQVSDYLTQQNLAPNAILLLDNASAHCCAEELKSVDGNISAMFFPPNTTALLQPLDQNIIKSLKMSYRKRLLVSLLSHNSANLNIALRHLTLREVVYMVVEAWNEINIETVKASFKHLFSTDAEIILNSPPILEEANIPIVELYHNLVPGSNMNDKEILDWASGKNEISTSLFTESDIIKIDETDNIYDFAGTDIDDALKGVNDALNWAESNLSISDILFLRNIREKMILKKLMK